MLEDKATEMGQDQENTQDVNSAVTREQFEQLTKQYELTKKELSSRDSKIGEYQKEMNTYKQSMEELKNSNLTETEKLNLKLKELELNVQTERSERTRATNKAEAVKLMNDLKIDTDLIDLVPLDDIDRMKATIEKLHSSTQKLMQAGAQTVVNKLGGNVPTGGQQPVGGIVNYEQYKTMTVSEQNKVLSENRLKK